MIIEGLDPGVLVNDPGRRGSLMRVFAAALAAVDPRRAVKAALVKTDEWLRIGARTVDLRTIERVVVLAFGKASVPMAQGIVEVLRDLPMEGVVVSNDPTPVEGMNVFRASHPVPDERSIAAAHHLVQAGSAARSGDLVIVAISGGGSALLTLPAADLSLEETAETTALLLRSGASIHELNTVRKHLSAVKGGRLATEVAGASAVLTLIMSDVVGDDLDVIASGPMVPDQSTFGDSLAILERLGLRDTVPPAVLAHLLAGIDGLIPETPSHGAPFDDQAVELVATARTAADGAARRATELGWDARIVSTTLTGEARQVADELVAAAGHLAPGQLLIYAGETTVTVVGDGVGGRSQELALAAAIGLAGDGGVVMLAAGTDGIDGFGDAAGAIVDGHTIERGTRLGLDARDFLSRNDSHRYLSAVGDLIVTGPTGTNVGDLILLARSG